MRLWTLLKNKMLNNYEQKVCEGHAEMTFEELIVFAESFSKKLKGIKCCAILCESEMAAGMVLLSCFAAGVTALPLSRRYGELYCNKILDAISPDAVITDEDGDFRIFHIKDAKFNKPDIYPALIMCTSGTTGIPKGAMLTEDNIVTNVLDIADYYKIGDKDTILIARPIYHCAVLTGEFLTALVKGTKIQFYSGIFNPSLMMKLVKQYEITAFCGTPTLLYMMSRFKRGEDALKHICISGECMDFGIGEKIANTFKAAEIYHIYGLTEASPRVAYLPPEQFKGYADCVGIPLKSVSLKILNADGEPTGKNEVGILWVKGDNVMAGYYNDSDKTAEVIKDGWLCTGDMALINDAGLLKIKGRRDELINKAGMNIYPAEIEAALKADPRVKEVLAYGIESKHGMHIGLKIAGDFNSVSEVKKLCSECLPYFQIPNYIEIFPELPKNASGKIARRI